MQVGTEEVELRRAEVALGRLAELVCRRSDPSSQRTKSTASGRTPTVRSAGRRASSAAGAWRSARVWSDAPTGSIVAVCSSTSTSMPSPGERERRREAADSAADDRDPHPDGLPAALVDLHSTPRMRSRRGTISGHDQLSTGSLSMRAVRIHSHGGPEVLQRRRDPRARRPGRATCSSGFARRRSTIATSGFVAATRIRPTSVDLPARARHRRLRRRRRGRLGGRRLSRRATASPRTRTCSAARCRYCMRGEFQLCPDFDVYNGTYAELFLVPARFAVTVDPSVPGRARRRLPERLHHRLADARRQGARRCRGHRLRLGRHERARLGRDRDREARAAPA